MPGAAGGSGRAVPNGLAAGRARPGRHEGPQHTVTIARPFAAGKYEVTLDEWDACVAGGGCARAADGGLGRGRRPVIRVSYEQAIGYTEWLSKKTGKPYRLLSEAEWEYAARAGSQAARFWGAVANRPCEFENGADAALERQKPEGWKDEWGLHACDDGQARTAPVGAFKPNAFGLHDMLGNLSEWVEDCAGAKKRPSKQKACCGTPEHRPGWRAASSLA
jgi:formylglycine-generating enzyme required for sulfatase activity